MRIGQQKLKYHVKLKKIEIVVGSALTASQTSQCFVLDFRIIGGLSVSLCVRCKDASGLLP